MLFNEPIFIFLFLPITWLLVLTSRGIGTKYILISASLFFYAYWNPKLIFLLISSIIFNYFLSKHFINSPRGKLSLIAGISLNLFTLGYFKYKNFFLSNICSLFECSYTFETLILPLGISFFTFQQISFLLDRYNNLEKHPAFIDFFLFISFFPQLVAGPIVGSRQFLPQINGRAIWIYQDYMWRGLTLFNIGLFKKIVIADQLAQNVLPVFKMAETSAVSFTDAWIGTLSFTFQIYFDFSAYSDMAIGLALMFGIILPINFNSPYKAANIQEFWRGWHITLSHFLRDRIYIPLGGNKKGIALQFAFIMITMLIGGLWHGASWNFVIWGGLHGIFIISYHAYSILFPRKAKIPKILSQLITFLLVSVAWVFFRAETLGGSYNIIQGLFGLNGFIIDYSLATTTPLNYVLSVVPLFEPGLTVLGFQGFKTGILTLPILMVFVLFLPNALSLVGYPNIKKDAAADKKEIAFKQTRLQPNLILVICLAIIFVMSLLSMGGVNEFIYFEF